MESGIRHFGTPVLGRDVYCRLDAARLEQMRANLNQGGIAGLGICAAESGPGA